MPSATFAVTFDYRCPFARNGHEHLLAALADGADWDVTFVPFSLGQAHVEEGQTPIWDRPQDDSGLWALQAGTVVRDRFPDRFTATHRALFSLRHDEGSRLSPADVTATLEAHLGPEDAAEVVAAIESGEALALVRKEHEAIVDGPGVWGVPTFVTGDDRAVFVRVMSRNRGETAEERAEGRRTIERIVDLLGWDDLNEFKATRLPR